MQVGSRRVQSGLQTRRYIFLLIKLPSSFTISGHKTVIRVGLSLVHLGRNVIVGESGIETAAIVFHLHLCGQNHKRGSRGAKVTSCTAETRKRFSAIVNSEITSVRSENPR